MFPYLSNHVLKLLSTMCAKHYYQTCVTHVLEKYVLHIQNFSKHHKGKISQVPMEKISSMSWHTCDFKIPAPPYLRFLYAIFSCVLAIFVILAIFRVKPYLRFFSQACFKKSQVWRAKGTACAQYRKYSKAKIASMPTLWQHQIASMVRGNRKYANSESQVCQDQIASIPKANRKYSK